MEIEFFSRNQICQCHYLTQQTQNQAVKYLSDYFSSLSLFNRPPFPIYFLSQSCSLPFSTCPSCLSPTPIHLFSSCLSLFPCPYLSSYIIFSLHFSSSLTTLSMSVNVSGSLSLSLCLFLCIVSYLSFTLLQYGYHLARYVCCLKIM